LEGKGEGTLDEALNKDIKAFGQDLDKNFKAAGFDTLILMQSSPTPEQLNIVKTNPKAAIFEVSQSQMAQMLIVRVNSKMISKAESIINKFQLSNYNGPVLQKGWTAKQVKGAINPGDIVKQDSNKNQGVWEFYRLAKVDTKVANVNEAKSYKVSKNSKEAQHLKKGDIIGSGDEVVSVSAGAKTPSGKVEVTLKTKDGKTKTSTWGKTTKVGVKEKETVKENKMTQRDKYLTRLVENALGLEGYGDDNVNRQREKQGLPPAQGPKYSEGITEDEMVEEKPLPKYENIEKLMQEIDKNTDEEAHKFKMQEMKRVADMLEKKCTALEEGDDADHIDQKKLKQMKKDIMSLRKGIEKMEKLGEKKFTKKETKAELKEGFDLRKFLVENKLTTNSRILNENFNDQTSAIEKFINEPLLGGYFINTIEGPMHSIDLQIATEPDNHEGKKLTDFEILGTARYYPNEKWEFRNGGQPIKSGKMPKLASKTPADDKLLAIIAAEIDRATPAAQ
jgi:hypothetical protein